jgi:hypothetical protein
MADVTTGLTGFAKEADAQAAFFDTHDGAVYGRLVREAAALFEEDEAARARILNAWSTRSFHAVYERPLLLAAAIHHEAQRDPAHPLAAAFRDLDPARVTRRSIAAALTNAWTLGALRDRYVQTNEVSRAIAWRLPLARLPAGTPVALVDLGCSAALNLVADALDLSWSDASGAPLDLPLPRVVERIGLDRAPLDASDPDTAAWLRACIWPGHERRRARLDAAITRATEARARGELTTHAMDAREMPAFLESLVLRPGAAKLIVAYQTVMSEYLMPEDRAAYEGALRDWLLRHSSRSLWLELERAPECAPGPVELRAHFAAGRAVRTLVLASAEYHPDVVTLNDAALRELENALAPCHTA